jgi:conjugal transfer pilus assembly protein TraI
MDFHARHPQLLFDDLGRSLFTELVTASGAGVDRFRAHYLPVAERLALLLQELPLERETFPERGGALKFALLSALTTLRLCDSVVFAPAATAEVRMRVEPQYRFAAFCASLASVPLVVHHNLRVTIEGQPWSPLSRRPFLWDALDGQGSYAVEWRPVTPARPSAALGVLILGAFFEAGQWAEFEPDVVRGMCEAINPAGVQSPAELALGKVVRIGHEKTRQVEQLRASAAFAPAKPSDTNALVASTVAGTAQPVMSLAPVSPPPSAPASAPEPAPLPQELVEWANAVAHEKQFLEKDVTLLPDGTVRVGVKALNHGAGAKITYDRLFTAGLVHAKEERGAVLVKRMADLFREAVNRGA